jgi:hypothetical protein
MHPTVGTPMSNDPRLPTISIRFIADKISFDSSPQCFLGGIFLIAGGKYKFTDGEMWKIVKIHQK